jgi:hypothetical protein
MKKAYTYKGIKPIKKETSQAKGISMIRKAIYNAKLIGMGFRLS